jgi:chromosome segregation ATPase
MKPDNMTEYFEKISGSSRYRDEYESTRKKIDE